MGLENQKCDVYDLSEIKVPNELIPGLQLLLTLQKSFGVKFCQFDNLSYDDKVKWTKEFILCIQQELAELTEQLPWKHWKDYSEYKVNETELKYEIIDILHFFLSLCLVWGMDAEEIFRYYFSKNKQNFERQEKGYKQKGG